MSDKQVIGNQVINDPSAATLEKPRCGSCVHFHRTRPDGGECHGELPLGMPMQIPPTIAGQAPVTVVVGQWKLMPVLAVGCPRHQDWAKYEAGFRPAVDALVVPTPEQNGANGRAKRLVIP